MSRDHTNHHQAPDAIGASDFKGRTDCMKIIHGCAAELTAAQHTTIAQLEKTLGEAYVTQFPWAAIATFENGTKADTIKGVTPDGNITP